MHVGVDKRKKNVTKIFRIDPLTVNIKQRKISFFNVCTNKESSSTEEGDWNKKCSCPQGNVKYVANQNIRTSSLITLQGKNTDLY